MKKLIAGLVLALAAFGIAPADVKANDGCRPPVYQPCGHWELRTYCRWVWVADCDCGHWEMQHYQQYVWVQD